MGRGEPGLSPEGAAVLRMRHVVRVGLAVMVLGGAGAATVAGAGATSSSWSMVHSPNTSSAQDTVLNGVSCSGRLRRGRLLRPAPTESDPASHVDRVVGRVGVVDRAESERPAHPCQPVQREHLVGGVV